MEALKRFEITSEINYYLHQLEWNSELAVATSLERVRNLQLDKELKLYCFNNANNIYEYSLKILMKKGFPLVDELNRFIQYASDGGLIVKWLKRNRFSAVAQKPSKYKFSESSSNSMLFNGMIFCGVSALSVLVCAIEILVHRNVQAKKHSKFWLHCQMCIDPYRYFLLKDLSY